MIRASSHWVADQGRSLADLVGPWLSEPPASLGTSASSGADALSSFIAQHPLLAATAATAVTMGVGYYFAKSNKTASSATDGSSVGQIEPLVDPKRQTIVLSDGSRVSAFCKDGRLIEYLFDDARTLYDGIRRGARKSNNGDMLGQRVNNGPYQWVKYDEVIRRADTVALGFRALELAKGQGTFVGIFAKNRPEWIIVEHATYAFDNVIVPLYDTLGFEACVYIINQAEMELVVCDTADKAAGLLKQKANCPKLRALVTMEEPSAAARAEASSQGVRLLSLAELEQLGSEHPSEPHQPPTPDSMATICYTSGTTGTPKGVMLTHRNVIADATTLIFFKYSGIVATDVMISFLPLAHMFERLLEAVIFMTGARVGYYRGDIRLLAEDIKELRPTVAPVVPRVLNRLYDKVMSEVNKSVFKRALFNVATSYKARELNGFVIRNDGLFDSLVFKRIRDGMGGRVRLMITGSAPLSENVLNFVRAAMGCIVVEGYGQTECVAACSVTMEGDSKPGHVGMPSPCCAIKLVDVPELNYFAKDQAGEVCIKGANVFKGYFKNEEQTRETIDEDGWLHTGDIGRWTEEGTLKIVDRKKHIFKLAQGEYVAPEKVENIYLRSGLVMQSFVHGESLKTCLIAIVVPDAEQLIPAMKAEGITGTIEELCQNPAVKERILADMHAIGKAAKLCSFEQVKDIYLHADPFTVENDLLTPTLKSKRPQLKTRFATQLAEMYSRLD